MQGRHRHRKARSEAANQLRREADLRHEHECALATREPSLSLPCFAERRYGGVPDDEMLMAAPVEYMVKALAGMEALGRNGLRYPFAPWGIQQDVRAGLAVSYPKI
jgi:uncharacterized protein (DUF169 family)